MAGNDWIRLDFDPRTSDTMYNYIWAKQPRTGAWTRVHNFGIDVRGPRPGGGDEINCVGMEMPLEAEGLKVSVPYISPLARYRQFDKNIGSAETIARYPDQTREEIRVMEHLPASLDFEYELDAERPCYSVKGRLLDGEVNNIVYIVSALWTNNEELPTHVYYEGFPEFDISRPEAKLSRMVTVENVGYVIYYRADGKGVPFAILPDMPKQANMCNFYDNSACSDEFGPASINQAFVPKNPAVRGCNDSGYYTTANENGTFDGVRVVFFPEFSWLENGSGRALRDRIEEKILAEYSERIRSWKRWKNWMPAKITLIQEVKQSP
ncbi:MAG: hypothetical protein JW909_09890 [Planctomycetes bacterium]|nr:hypothetical protein [Planctomycetota bacterium]